MQVNLQQCFELCRSDPKCLNRQVPDTTGQNPEIAWQAWSLGIVEGRGWLTRRSWVQLCTVAPFAFDRLTGFGLELAAQGAYLA